MIQNDFQYSLFNFIQESLVLLYNLYYCLLYIISTGYKVIINCGNLIGSPTCVQDNTISPVTVELTLLNYFFYGLLWVAKKLSAEDRKDADRSRKSQLLLSQNLSSSNSFNPEKYVITGFTGLCF